LALIYRKDSALLVEIDVYTVNHKSVGRLVIYDLNTEELEKVRESKEALPKDISLWFV